MAEWAAAVANLTTSCECQARWIGVTAEIKLNADKAKIE
jgi:hypothetical protein